VRRLARLATAVTRPAGAATLAGLIALAFVLFLPKGEDAAAHLYLTQVWRDQGWQFWDNFWYAGRYSQINYSLLYYPLAGILGTATVVAGTVAAAVAAFARLTRSRWPSVATWPTVAFALLAPLPVLTGTYPFLLGLALALAALAALQEGHRKLTIALAVLVAAAHLLALLLLVTALVGIALGTPQWWRRTGVRTLAIAFALIVGAVGLMWRAFSTPGGQYPFEAKDLIVVLAFCTAGALLARGRPDLRILLGVFAVYAVLAIGAFVVSSPLGANVGRLLLFMGAPLLLVPLAARGFRPRGIAVALLGGVLLWQTFPAVAGLHAATEVRASSEEFWYPVEAFLAEHANPNYRVEVVATDHHWEAFFLARRGIPLTRGWYRQDDFPANQDLYGTLTARTYRTWLRRLGVRYVFLPDDKLDYSAEAEAALLRSGRVLPVVAKVGSWSVFEVPSPTPIATPRGLIKVREMDAETVTLEVARSGSYRLRLRYTPYWRVVRGSACVVPREPWATELRVARPGYVTLRFAVGVDRVVKTVLGQGPKCPEPMGPFLLPPPTADPSAAPTTAPQGSSPGGGGTR
jgi:hypothetical protein